MAELIVDGETFNVLVEGEEGAPVLMLSNSLGTNLHMWDKQIAALKEHFRVVRYDSRGHGGSIVTEGTYTIAQLGRDALAIMDALGFDKVHWLGLSKGGMVGQWLLINAPERIDRAVLANTAAQIGAANIWNDRIRAALENGMAALAPNVIERWFTKDFREAHPHQVEPVQAMLEATSPIGYAGCCAAIRDMDLLAALPAVENPTLVIVGSQDPATSPEMGALIASAIPGAQLVTLDTAHLSNIEDTAGFNQAVIAFLTAGESELAAVEAQSADAAADETPLTDTIAADDMHAEAPKKPRRKTAPRKPAPTASDTAPASHAETAPLMNGPLEEPQNAAVAEAEHEPIEAESAAKPAAARTARGPAPRRRPAKKTAAARSAARKTVARSGVAKRAPQKKTAVKKPAAKKAATKKTAVKTTARKAVAKKTSARKAVAKKAVTKKAVTKKAATKKLAVRKTPAKKTVARKAVAKKAVLKRSPAKKVVVKKAATRKVAVKKVATKALKKAAPKKAVKKTAVKKAAGKKFPVKKAAVKKAAVKKLSTKKMTAKKPVRRGASRTTGRRR